jgi:hypothetical protein
VVRREIREPKEGVGPFEERLNEFGRVRPLVFWPFADVNSEFNVAIKEMAVQGAKKRERMVTARFDSWTRGNFRQLVTWWQADLVKARLAKPRSAAENNSESETELTVTIRKAQELLQSGFMSKAANRLSIFSRVLGCPIPPTTTSRTSCRRSIRRLRHANYYAPAKREGRSQRSCPRRGPM